MSTTKKRHTNDAPLPMPDAASDPMAVAPGQGAAAEEDDNEEVAATGGYKLPKDKDLPVIVREIVTNAPPSRKVPAFVASMSPLCALASRVRVCYYHDPSRLHALLLQVIIEGAQSAGKSFVADVESLIMKDTLRARDNAQRRQEQEYREKSKRRKANEKMDKEPQTTIRVIPPTISKSELTKRADFYERIQGDTMTFWMFSEELAQVTDAGKQAYSNLRTIMRTAYDLGALFGIDFMSENSYSAIVDINICSMFCATPSAVDDYYDKKAIEGGNITRCIICPIGDDVENDDELFEPYTDQQLSVIRRTLTRMMEDSYDEQEQLQPICQLDMKWIDRDCRGFIKRKAREFSLSGSEAIKVFRKRSSVSAFRIASLCYYLYSIEWGFDPKSPAGLTRAKGEVADPASVELNKKKLRAQRLCRQIYLFMSEYIMQGMMSRWGRRFNELNAKRGEEGNKAPKPTLFDQLTPEFTRDQLKILTQQLGITTPVRQFIWLWGPKNLNLIEAIDKNHYRKL